ncbi:hypothetical protein PX699_22570 [Sphingobium sp. H39-3-25]|uniref:hypothetical protein n=1 Tax=Sphingomonadales TaxID=204457 RepID=UPI00082E2572|nr:MULTISPECIES: hypothetical protein [Sphingomonadaceae]MDF0491127.1 hypothetical protein [Sphingomonas pollutisoli]MDF0545141.1 hypothetical protein [Sphingobium arseniciresistens]
MNMRPHSGLAVMLPLALLAAPAQAQDNPRDAEAYPCDQRGDLTVVQDGPSYSIRPRLVVAQAPSPTNTTATAISIGTALKVDSRIFAQAGGLVKEASHAPRR